VRKDISIGMAVGSDEREILAFLGSTAIGMVISCATTGQKTIAWNMNRFSLRLIFGA
jgi:hypothetical protein